MNTRSTCQACGKGIPEAPARDALCVRCRYDDAPPKLRAIEHDSSEYAVALDTFDGGELDDDDDTDLPESHRIIAAFLRKMTADAPALAVGQCVIALAYLTGQSDCKTHRELAARLNVSPARVSQIMRQIPQEFASLLRLKHRTAVDHPLGEG